MKLLILVLLGVIIWLINRLNFITRAYRDDLNDVQYQLRQLQEQTRSNKNTGKDTHAISEKININTASKTRLQSLPSIGAVTAQRIIDARPFAELKDLLQVEGIKADLMDRLEQRICL